MTVETIGPSGRYAGLAGPAGWLSQEIVNPSPRVEIAGRIGQLARLELSSPRRRAYWAGWLTTFAYCAMRGRPSPIAAIFLAELGGQVTMRAWQAAQDLRTIAEKAAAAAEPVKEAE